MTLEEINKIPVFFIVGMPRSGTTLLRTIFDAHLNVAIPMECKFILYFKKKYRNETAWNEKKVLCFLDELYKYEDFEKNVGADREKITQLILSFPHEKLRYSLICKMVLMQYPSVFNKEKVLMIGDKNPLYTLFVEDIWSIFPNAKFIHLVRDYRDVILSHKLKFGVNDLAGLAHTWKFYSFQMDFFQSKNPHLYKMVKYEDLVSNPIIVLKDIFQFLQLNYDENVLRFHETINEKFEKENLGIEILFPELKNKVNISQIGKWKEGFNLDEQEILQSIAGNRGIELGYQSNVTSKKYFLLSISGFWRRIINKGLIRLYYDSPLWIREMSKLLTHSLYKKTGILTVFNRANYVDEILQERKQNENL